MRIAIIDYERCSPDKCSYECIRYCPMNLSGVEAIVLEDEKPVIKEDVCTGCGICVKKCPRKAITIVNTPEALSEDELVHRYAENAFALFRLPVPREGKVVGLIGSNGVGKTTSIKILSGQMKPNLGNYKNPPEWDEIIRRFRGQEIQRYLERLASGEIKASVKPQHVHLIPKAFSGTAGELLRKFDERGIYDEISEELFLRHLLDRKVSSLSGGELQRLAIAVAISREADVYFFDEPSSFLDIRERVRVAKAIRSLAEKGKPVLVAEHDLAMLDYLSDYIHIYYGKPGAFGVVSHPYSSREGVNVFLDGYLPDENIRFREALRFVKGAYEVEIGKKLFEYPEMSKSLGSFKLEVRSGEIYEGEIIVILGPNGIGKTTFARLIVGELKPDGGDLLPRLRISYKPQYISAEGIERLTVKDFILEANPMALSDQWIRAGILKPLGVLDLLDNELGSLSGGELQKAFIARTLVKEADIYMLDEPSAYISAEDRVNVASAIRRIIRGHKAAFVVEHDLMLSLYLADRVIVFSGEPGRIGIANPPESVKEGMNRLLRDLSITVRKEPKTGRPRINKPGSRLDREQRSSGRYFGG